MNPFGALWNFISGSGASAKRQLQALYNTQAVIEFTPDGRILTANPSFLGLMGYDLDQLRGQHHRLFVDPEGHDEQAYRAFWEQLARGDAFLGRCKRRTGAGKPVWL